MTSCRGLNFTVGNGEKVPNGCLSPLNLEADDGRGGRERPMSMFPEADFARPLMSVSQICEQGHQVVLKDSHALFVHALGDTVCRFQRSWHVYSAKMTLKAPAFLAGRASCCAASTSTARKTVT